MPGYKQKIGENKYRLFVSNGFRKDGKPNRATRTVIAKSDRAADKMLQEFYLEFSKKPAQISNSMLFKSFADKWLAEWSKKLSPNTYQGDCSIVNSRLKAYFGSMRLSKINAGHLVEYFAELRASRDRADNKQGKISAGTIFNIYKVLRRIFNKAVEWGYINTNPCNEIPKNQRPKKIYNRPDILEVDELKIFLDELFVLPDNQTNTKHKLFIYLSMLDGCRLGEHIALTWDDINWKEKSISITKSIYVDGMSTLTKGTKTLASNRIVYLDDRAMMLLQKHKEFQEKWLIKNGLDNPAKLVFIKRKTNSVELPSRSMFWHWLNSFLKKIGLRHIPIHSFRRMAASYALSKNVPLTAVQAMLGHSSISTTNIYLRSLSDSKKDCTNVISGIYGDLIQDTQSKKPTSEEVG